MNWELTGHTYDQPPHPFGHFWVQAAVLPCAPPLCASEPCVRSPSYGPSQLPYVSTSRWVSISGVHSVRLVCLTLTRASLKNYKQKERNLPCRLSVVRLCLLIILANLIYFSSATFFKCSFNSIWRKRCSSFLRMTLCVIFWVKFICEWEPCYILF